jgi:hypothetical protein
MATIHIPAVPPHPSCLVLSKTRTTIVCVRPCNNYVGLRQRGPAMLDKNAGQGLLYRCQKMFYMCYLPFIIRSLAQRAQCGMFHNLSEPPLSLGQQLALSQHARIPGDHTKTDPSICQFKFVGKGQMNPKQSRVEGSFEHHRYVAVDAIPHKPKLGIVYRLLLRVVMCFCNDEGLLVGPRTAVTILAANRKSGCVGPICSLVTFFLSQMMFRAGNPCCPRIVILRCYSVVESIKLVYAIWPWRSVYYVQGWVAYRA